MHRTLMLSALLLSACYSRFSASPDDTEVPDDLDTQAADTDPGSANDSSGDDTSPVNPDDTSWTIGTEPTDGVVLFEWDQDVLAETYPADTETGQTAFQWLNPDDIELLGMRLAQFKMNPSHPGQYRTVEGEDPIFYVLYPQTPPTGPSPVLVWLHGGVVGEIGDPVYESSCSRSRNIMELLKNALINHDMILHEAAERGWVVVVPESTWCDLWAGLGPDDPVNQDVHSLEHIGWILDALESGLLSAEHYAQFDGAAGYDSEYLEDLIAHMVVNGHSYPVDPTRYYAWGTSIGGAGVMPVAWGNPDEPVEFAGVIADSGPHQYTTWYDIPDYTGVMTSLLGGTAEDFPENYARVDGGMLVEDLGFRVPVFLTYNTYDKRTPVYHGSYLREKLEAYYPAAGVNYFAHDTAHLAPGRDYHTQTTPNDNPPWTYTIDASFRFLDGAKIQIVEAEAICAEGACLYDSEYTDDRNPADGDLDYDFGQWVSRYSGGTGVASACSYCALYCEGGSYATSGLPGAAYAPQAAEQDCDACATCDDADTVLFSGALPATVPRGTPLALTVISEGDGIDGLEGTSAFATIRIEADGATLAERTVLAGEMADPGTGTLENYVSQLEATTFEDLTLPKEGDVTITVTFAGQGQLWIDGFWIAY